MATITLIIDVSSNQLVSGIPEYIDFSTNVPSNVFYTLDGTEPGEDSLIAAGNSSMTMADRVYLPTSGSTVTVKAKAVSSDSSSDVFSKTYYADVDDLNGPRHISEEGINVMPYGATKVDNLYLDKDGNSAAETSISFSDLDMKASTVDSSGVATVGGSSLSFINILENTSTYTSDNKGNSSTPNDENIYFDPKAGLVILDGTTRDKLDGQVVQMINRPAESMDTVSKFYNENSQQKQAPVTANLVRYIYNPNTGYIKFYYYESKESRWIISKQKFDPKQLNINTPNPRGRTGGYVVVRWIQERTMSKFF